ncbi:MAG: hypothetical protein Q8M29_09910 [Bacteroidota bacterium]|nr:hypothetical protein [Bacteroidota bacterium]
MRLSGILLNVNRTVQDSEILLLVNEATEETPENSHFETITSDEFEGVGILRINNTVLILEKSIAHGCSFDEIKPSIFDDELAALSSDGQVLCFLINSYSDTYAYSYFKNGARLSYKGSVGAEDLPNALENEDLGKVEMTESDIIALIEKIGSFYFDDLWKLEASQVLAYHTL